MEGKIVTKKITELEENTTIDDTDILMAGDKGTNALKRFTIGAFLTAIKAKLAAWTFDTLQTTSKTLPGAVNELNSNTFKIRGNLNSGMAIENLKSGLYSAITDLPDWYGIRYSYLFVPSNNGSMNGAFAICYQTGTEKGIYYYNVQTSAFEKI